MAPRRRPLKKGERRMDAALDAMAPFGFPNKLVRQTVDQLLTVYGGNDGWVFIEDSAYTLLINTLLEQQQDQDCLIEDNPGNGPNEASPAGCSNRALVPCSNTEASNDALLTNQAVDAISATSETGNQLAIVAVDTATATSKTVDEPPIKPISVNTSEATIQSSNHPSAKAVDTVSATNEIDNQALVKAIKDIVSTDIECVLPQRKSSQPMGRLYHKRRRPCHGWISSDGDDEEELIELPNIR